MKHIIQVKLQKPHIVETCHAYVPHGILCNTVYIYRYYTVTNNKYIIYKIERSYCNNILYIIQLYNDCSTHIYIHIYRMCFILFTVHNKWRNEIFNLITI